MKIKLSKSQWEAIGKKGGWIKQANIIKTAWGYPPPEETHPKFYWGVRAIFQSNKWSNYKPSFDFVFDRQSFDGDINDPESKDFIQWINKEAIPALKKDKNVQRWTSSSRDLFTFESDKYIFKATNNGSYGYTYIGAWSKEGKPLESKPEEAGIQAPTVPPKL